MSEIGFHIHSKLALWRDNISVDAFAINMVFHAHTKYIEMNAHFVRDHVLCGTLEIRYVPSNDQLADCLTKPLNHSQFGLLRSKLGVVELSSRLREDIKEKNQECKIITSNSSSKDTSPKIQKLTTTNYVMK